MDNGFGVSPWGTMAGKMGARISRPTFAPGLGGGNFELLHDSMGTAVPLHGGFLGWRKGGEGICRQQKWGMST